MPSPPAPPAATRTWVERLQHEATADPSRSAFVFLAQGEEETQQLSWGELDARARAIAVELAARLPGGSRVLLLHPSGLDFIAALFGCLYAGMIAVPAYPSRARHRSVERLLGIVADADAGLALMDSVTLARLQPEFAANPRLAHVVLATTDTVDPSAAARWREPAIGPDTVAMLQYTSGSTARPRGVVLTHRVLLHNAEVIRQAFATSGDQTNVGWLPLHHDMGLIGNVLGPVYVGGRGILMPPEAFLLKPERWLRAISRYRARSGGAPNFAYALCVDRVSDAQKATLDLAHWQLAYCGAEPIRAQTLKRFADAFAPCGFRREALYPCYGLAEATLLVAGGPAGRPPVVTSFAGGAMRERHALPVAADADDARALVSCGYPWHGQQVRIVDPDTRRECPPGQIGEICIAGGSVAPGYWRQPDATAETFGLVLAETATGPWLRTGDLGFTHAGELYVSGRLKSLIIVAGRNHLAEDIEDTVEQAHRAICPHGAAAFTVDADDGERLVVVAEVERAFLPQLRGEGGRPAPARDEIARAIRAAVAERHELSLQAVHLVRPATIPRTSSGKIQRHATRAAYAAGTLRAVDDALPPDVPLGTAHAGP